jgi:hypothetical protein
MLASKIICNDTYSNKLWYYCWSRDVHASGDQPDRAGDVLILWSGSSAAVLILRCHVTFKLVSNTTFRPVSNDGPPQPAPTPPTKAPLISAQVALLCLLSLPTSPWLSNYPQSDNKNIPFLTPPPDTTEASQPQPHPHHRFHHKHHPMHVALHFARLYRQIQGSSSLTATNQDLF